MKTYRLIALFGRFNKNSNNSSTPPPKENMKDENIRRTKSLRKPTGRKPSVQLGHEGSTLKMTDKPDETEDVYIYKGHKRVIK